MQDIARWLKIRFMMVLFLALTGAVAGCDGGGSSLSGAAAGGDPPTGNPPAGSDPPAVGTVIPTAPTGLPALLADAGGPSAGFNIVTSPGMVAPAVVVTAVPQMTGGDIIDQDAAIRLGKAFFWDMQTGSDGQIACASCHFMAGADNRTRNTVHPGSDALFAPTVVAGPGGIFNLVTFNPGAIDDVVGSSGVISRLFGNISTDPADPVDICTPLVPANSAQTVLAAAGERLVTGRNTPPAVGAVFYLDNFWDGRASQKFNGQNPLGTGATLRAQTASLASQAVGPPGSDVEMSCANRPFNGANSLGAKLVPRTPLANQFVAPTDSVLGGLANAPGNGLDCGFPDRLCTYADLIAAAFGTNGLSGQAAVNAYIDDFANIWGQAVQAYEATLVPNRTPYDLGLLTANQVAGLQSMRGKGCLACHVEPEFSDATVRQITAKGGTATQKVVLSNGQPVVAGGDQGFHNIGSGVTANDRGRAASPGGTYHDSVFNEGAFKTPGLRNVALTAPFMHNGSIATIPDVINFYNGQNMVNDPLLNPGFDETAKVGLGGQRAAAADFLRVGLLDCRVENELAPFDHPALVIPNGPALPAVGRSGNGTICP
jgi:cytochrome c peroxidase